MADERRGAAGGPSLRTRYHISDIRGANDHDHTRDIRANYCISDDDDCISDGKCAPMTTTIPAISAPTSGEELLGVLVYQ